MACYEKTLMKFFLTSVNFKLKNYKKSVISKVGQQTRVHMKLQEESKGEGESKIHKKPG